MNERSFLKGLILITAILLLVATGVQNFQERLTIPNVVIWIIPAFAILTYFMNKIMIKADAKSPQWFMTAFMGTLTFKLLFSIFFLGIYLFLSKDHRAEVAISFFIIYMTYTIFEVVHMTRFLRS